MKRSKKVGMRGFTLIELMIVVAIIGILAAIAIPKFAELLRKSNEGATKGNLGSLRSALTIYYSDTEGSYPEQATFAASLTTGGKYMGVIPSAYAAGHHGKNPTVSEFSTAVDDGGWAYEEDSDDPQYGHLAVGCAHTDTRGTTWSQY